MGCYKGLETKSCKTNILIYSEYLMDILPPRLKNWTIRTFDGARFYDCTSLECKHSPLPSPSLSSIETCLLGCWEKLDHGRSKYIVARTVIWVPGEQSLSSLFGGALACYDIHEKGPPVIHWYDTLPPTLFQVGRAWGQTINLMMPSKVEASTRFKQTQRPQTAKFPKCSLKCSNCTNLVARAARNII